MYIWAVLIGGSLLLPVATVFRTDMPQLAAETLSVVGVLGLFLAICATEVVGTGAARREANRPD